eukprot:gene36288-biopygen503
MASINILSDLLTFDKIEDGELKLDRQEISVKDLVLSSTAIFQAQAREKNISLSTEINFGQHHHLICKDTGSPQDEGGDLTTRLVDDMKVQVDRHKMSQVIHNLVSNAIKFTPPGGHVSVAVSLDDGSDWITNVRESNSNGMYDCALVAGPFVKITVADTGVGLSQENIRKLFRQVIQFNPEVLQAGGGSGLGLYISKSIVDLHGGDISVVSMGENQGSTFTVTFPIKPFVRTGSSRTLRSATRVLPALSFFRSASTMASSAWQHIDNSPQLRISSGGIPYQLNEGEKKNSSNERVMEDSRSLKGSEEGEMNEGRLQFQGEESDGSPSTLSSFLVPVESHSYSAVNWSFRDKIYPQSIQLAEPKYYSNTDTFILSPENPPEVKNDYPLRRVLVVDDAVSNRKMLCRVIRNRCSVIVEADNGLNAVDMVKASLTSSGSLAPNGCTCQPFDLIIMDFIMPVMDGPTAIKEIRGLGYTGLILGLTGNVLDSDKNLMLKSGANFVLTKPFELDAFDRALQECKQEKARVIVSPETGQADRPNNIREHGFQSLSLKLLMKNVVL